MVAPTGSNIHSVFAEFPQKAGRLTLRLLLALGLVATITFVFFRLIHVNATTVGFFYLVAILVIATLGGLPEASVSSVVAMLCFNFFFFPPVGTFTVADPQNWVALFAFLATALTASQLSARLKRQKKRGAGQAARDGAIVCSQSRHPTHRYCAAHREADRTSNRQCL